MLPSYLAGSSFPRGQYSYRSNDDDFFVEQHGYFMDQELLAASAGYVRDSFVMASLDQLSEYEHLERILLDAVQSAPIHYDVETLCNSISPSSDRYSKYQREPYKPLPHYKRET